MSIQASLLALCTLVAATGAARAGEHAGAPLTARAGEDARAFVVADVLQVRAAARPDAPVSGRLRIGTEVHVRARAAPFVEIALPGHAPLAGFVDERFLAAAPLDKPDALARSARAQRRGRLREAIRWAERAVALDGDPETWRRLSALYEAKGDTVRAARARDVLAGRAPVYLAACLQGRAYLLARHDPERGLTELASEAGPADDLEALSLLLAGAPWFALEASGPRLIEGTPFPHPEVSVVWNAGHPTLPGGGLALVLGGCPEGAALYATAPLAHVDEERARRRRSVKRARRHLAKALSVSLSDPVARAVSLAHTEAPVEVLVVDSLARTRGAEVRAARLVSVHDARGRIGVTIGGPREPSTSPSGDDVWLALPSGAALGVLPVERRAPGKAGAGFALLLVDEGGPVRHDVMVALSSDE